MHRQHLLERLHRASIRSPLPLFCVVPNRFQRTPRLEPWLHGFGISRYRPGRHNNHLRRAASPPFDQLAQA